MALEPHTLLPPQLLSIQPPQPPSLPGPQQSTSWAFQPISVFIPWLIREICITPLFRKPLSGSSGYFWGQFPSYLKDYSCRFTWLSFWARPAEWEEMSRHALCPMMLFFCRVKAGSPRLGGGKERMGSFARWLLEKILALEWNRLWVWNQPHHSAAVWPPDPQPCLFHL